MKQTHPSVLWEFELKPAAALTLHYQTLKNLKNPNISQHFFAVSTIWSNKRTLMVCENDAIKLLNITVFLFVQIISLPLKMHFSEQHLSTDFMCHQYCCFFILFFQQKRLLFSIIFLTPTYCRVFICFPILLSWIFHQPLDETFHVFAL